MRCLNSTPPTYRSADLETVVRWWMHDCKLKFSVTRVDLCVSDFREWAWKTLTVDKKIAARVRRYAQERTKGATFIVRQDESRVIKGFDLILPDGSNWGSIGWVTRVLPIAAVDSSYRTRG
jgi:hypothetical protein